MSTPALARAAARKKHDLPPAWDGEPVQWRGWQETQTSMRFHALDGCEKCGVVNEPSSNIGRRPNVEGIEWMNGGWLVAYRCPDCGHDTVHDQRDDTYWDLTPEDYLDDGSTVEGALW